MKLLLVNLAPVWYNLVFPLRKWWGSQPLRLAVAQKTSEE
jgi:hypothetical protein